MALRKGRGVVKEQVGQSGAIVSAEPDGKVVRAAYDPDVPSTHKRTITIGMGPAKGWRVTAWLKDKTDSGDFDGTVRWRITSPGRKHSFIRFNSCSARNLQDNVSEGIHTQIYTGARRELQKKMSVRRMVLEHRAYKKRKAEEGDIFKQAKRAASSAGSMPPPAAPFRRPPARAATVPAVPRSQQDWSGLATQPFSMDAQYLPATSSDWPSGCEARLERHSACVAGTTQPRLVHLKDYMLVGRGDCCDVVLNSRLTPQMISRCHAVLNKEEDCFTITDQGSMNGISINGEVMNGKHALKEGDIITFGVQTQAPEFDYVFRLRPAGECGR